ncbi:MAG: hypothetical protein Q9183_005995 [Haloplaca sp. 2 TL-2023]
MVPSNGIILNNQMNDFSIPNISNVFGYEPSPANYIAPGKRPLSSMSPVIAETRASHSPNPGIVVLGSAGGSRIITAVVQLALSTLLHTVSAFSAVSEPRVHDQLLPNITTFEWEYDNKTVEAMMERGHEVKWLPPGYSSAHVVQRLGKGKMEAVAEVRQKDRGNSRLSLLLGAYIASPRHQGKVNGVPSNRSLQAQLGHIVHRSRGLLSDPWEDVTSRSTSPLHTPSRT